MRAIGKRDIAESIARSTGKTQTEVRDIIDQFIEHIKVHFRDGLAVELHWFGTFYPHFKKERAYKVPKTGEVRTMPARITLKFKASKHMYVFKGNKK